MNKIVLILISFYLFASCTLKTKSEDKPLTTEDKIKDAITKIWEQKINSKGEKVEIVSIDSIKYETGNYNDLYGKDLQKQIDTFFYNNLDRWLTDDSILLKKAAKTRDSLRKNAPKGEYFKVKYTMNTKSDKNTYPYSNEINLDSKSLKEIVMPVF